MITFLSLNNSYLDLGHFFANKNCPTYQGAPFVCGNKKLLILEPGRLGTATVSPLG